MTYSEIEKGGKWVDGFWRVGGEIPILDFEALEPNIKEFTLWEIHTKFQDLVVVHHTKRVYHIVEADAYERLHKK